MNPIHHARKQAMPIEPLPESVPEPRCDRIQNLLAQVPGAWKRSGLYLPDAQGYVWCLCLDLSEEPRVIFRREGDTPAPFTVTVLWNVQAKPCPELIRSFEKRLRQAPYLMGVSA
ncbi:MAG: hypothetical protein RBU21_02845 [FCB group bacterium]|jgi:hypothetical protein|nr:hypothetical protein [FCB group bacterium]